MTMEELDPGPLDAKVQAPNELDGCGACGPSTGQKGLHQG